jgi:hypothetical protein
VFSALEAVERVEGLKGLVREVLVPPHLEEYAATLVRVTLPATSVGSRERTRAMETPA